MECPKCHAVVAREQVAAGLARCQWCDHVWTLEPSDLSALALKWAEEKRNPPVGTPGRRARGLARIPPAGVEVEEAPDGVTLRIPWVQGAGMVTHAIFIGLTLGFGGVVVGGTLNGEILDNPGGFLVALFTLCAFAVGYAYVLVNATVVIIRPMGVEVSHGPLPSYLDSDVNVSLARLGSLRVEETLMSVHRGRQMVRHYSLWAGRTRLLRKFSEEEVVTYVAEVIADTVDTAVEIRSY